MAGIIHSNSIVADSTTSRPSSPDTIHEGLGDDNCTPASVVLEPQFKPKRAAKTYGRPRSVEDVEEVTNVDLVSRARILKTAPRDADDQVIPESDDATGSGLKFTGFAWREKLKEIDESINASGNGEATHYREVTQGVIAEDDRVSNTREVFSEVNEPYVVSGDLITGRTLFDDTLSSLLSEPISSPPQSISKRIFPDNDKPLAFPKEGHFDPHKHIIDSPRASDSDDGSPNPYPINSPKRRSPRSSPTSPPTSPLGELALQDSMARSKTSTKATKKGTSIKGKDIERRSRKALTKKEMDLMHKETARIQAGRHVSLERTQGRSTHTIASLFNKLKPPPMTSKPDSDPIVPFSSPVFRMDDQSLADEPGTIHLRKNSGLYDRHTERIIDNKSDEDMPEADALLHGENKHVDARRAIVLEEQKLKALDAIRHSRSKGSSLAGSDTDNDLEVEGMVSVGQEEASKNSEVHSEEQTLHTVYNEEIKIDSKSQRVSLTSLERASKPAFISSQGPNRQRGQQVSVSQKDLNDLLLQRADRQGGAIQEKKREQWMKAGGVLKEHHRPETEERLVTDWLHQGSTRHSVIEVEENDDDDPEYEPNLERHEGEESDDETRATRAPDDERVPHQRIDTSDEDVDADKENHRPLTRRQTIRAIVDSDDDEEISNRAQLRILVPDTSLVEHSDDSPEEDKENRAELAFSFGENKENESVPMPPEHGRVMAMDELRNSESSLTFSSPGSHVVNNSTTGREPLRRLDAEAELSFVLRALTQRRDDSLNHVLQEDKDATLAPSSVKGKEGLHRSSSTSSDPENLDGPTLVSPVGFSQLFDESHLEGPAPGSVLGTGRLSQFLSQADTGANFCATPSKGHSSQAQDSNFEFTQPNVLLPSISISESQRREVDLMFGKDQEFKLDEAKAFRKQIDATCSGSDTLHIGSFVPSQVVQTPPSIRRPLETLSLETRSDDTLLDKTPPMQSPRRVRLLRERPQASSSTSPSSAKKSRDAFDVLLDAASRRKQKENRSGQTNGKLSEYVEVEAQESDEEAMLGFGGVKENDDDEGRDEDPGVVVEGLVDDAILDEKTQAKDLVIEKHREHQVDDDAEVEKLHQDAISGKLRGKRRDRGLGFEDSESDEDDISSSRKSLLKRRRVDGDTLEVLGKDPTTYPFYKEYHEPLTEHDDDSLACFEEDHSGFAGEDMSKDSSEDECPEVVDPTKIRQQIIHEMSNEGLRSFSPGLDPENASWVDSEDQDMVDTDDIRVENGPLHSRKGTKATSSTRLDHVEYKGIFQSKKSDTSEERQLKSWASQESRAQTSATGRGGFSRNDSTGLPRKREKSRLMRDSSSNDGKTIVKQSSLISHVEKRKGFDG